MVPASRRFVLVLVLFLGAAAPARAQGFTGALQLGVAATTLTGESGNRFEPKAALAGGLSVGFDFGNGLVLATELLYVPKGAFTELDLNGAPSRVRFNYTYIEVPLLALYRLPVRSRIRPVLFAGPGVALNRDARLRYRALAGGPTFDETDDLAEPVDYTVVLGVGADVALGTERLTVTLRASLGVSDVREQDAALRNRGLVLLVGVGI